VERQRRSCIFIQSFGSFGIPLFRIPVRAVVAARRPAFSTGCESELQAAEVEAERLELGADHSPICRCERKQSIRRLQILVERFDDDGRATVRRQVGHPTVAPADPDSTHTGGQETHFEPHRYELTCFGVHNADQGPGHARDAADIAVGHAATIPPHQRTWHQVPT
jgi:hypothetical protein